MFRHLLRIDYLTEQHVDAILTLARIIKDKVKRGVPHRTLIGKVLGMIFEKPSVTARVSFEVGMYQLGGTAFHIDASSAQWDRRSGTLADTARVMSRFLDGVVVRASSHEHVEEFARNSSVPVINGLTDRFHPCQVLSDLFTIQEKLGDLHRCKIAYIGDGNNVANSWINAAATLGFPLVLACPEGFEPDASLLGRAPENIRLVRDPREAVQEAHVIYAHIGWETDEAEGEEATRHLKGIFAPYQINKALLQLAPKAIVMHCLPVRRGLEITPEIADSPLCVALDQVENRLHVQKAIMELLLGDRKPKGIQKQET